MFKTRKEKVRAHLKKDFTSGLLKKGHLCAPCREIGILDFRKFLLVDRKLESGKIVLVEYGIQGLESGMLLKAFGISLTIGVQSPSSFDKDYNPVLFLDSLIWGDHLGTLKILNTAQMDSIGHPDPETRGGGGLQKTVFRPFGPHFGRKIRKASRDSRAPPLDPQLQRPQFLIEKALGTFFLDLV